MHSGKVRSVYWLTREDSARLIKERDYPAHPSAELAIMVISDRLSAFECMWRAEVDLTVFLEKGRTQRDLGHWFQRFSEVRTRAKPHP